MAPKIIKVKVQPLTEEAVKPYGHVLEQKRPLFPEVEPGEGRVAMEVLKLKRPADPKHIDWLAIHYSYNQSFIPLLGSMILVLAPAPPKVGAKESDYPVDYSKLAAFYVEPGQGLIIDKGVWHGGTTLSSECLHVNVTRKDPEEKTSDQFASPTDRGYVEIVEVGKRDNTLIELEF